MTLACCSSPAKSHDCCHSSSLFASHLKPLDRWAHDQSEELSFLTSTSLSYLALAVSHPQPCADATSTFVANLTPIESSSSNKMAEAQSSTAIISPSLVQPLSSPNRAELENRPNPIVEIAASGDIILVVGPKQVRLCVYSQILKTVSKPFSAMLSPTWNPGCSLPSATSPVEYFLPEDDADAMKYVCAVLHHQNHILPRPMETCDIFQISVIADKYDLLGALEFASESWLADRDGSCVCDWELTRLAAAAYTFQDAEAFKDTTRALVLNYSGSFLDIADKELKSAMGLEVFCECFLRGPMEHTD